MASGKEIQCLEYRRLARLNCYRYGPFYIYADDYVSLDSHDFPNYHSKDGTGAVEKFLTLIQSLGTNANGNDPNAKLARPLPGVAWDSDKLDLSISLSGTMYFTDFRDWQSCKKAIRQEFVSQGWKQTKSSMESAGISILTYIPAKDGADALFNEDPVDAAGMAMMTSAMQNVTLQSQKLSANVFNDYESYADASARLETRQALNEKKHPTLSKIGSLGADIGAGIEAMGANMNSDMVAKWATAGHPVELLIEGAVASQSVRGVLVDASLTERAFVVDSTSGNAVYPTEMKVSLTVKNMYGSLLTASQTT